MHKCAYGCNSEGHFQMTSGKWCCAEHWNKCEGKRNKDSLMKRDSIPWNKGLVGLKGHPQTEEARNKLSTIAKSRGLGGYVPGCGRGKKGIYDGMYFDSSWELAFMLYCKHHNIPIARNKQWFNYEYNGETKRYLPDFIRTDRSNYFIEIKGFFTDKEISKIKSFPHKLKIYSGNGMKKILSFVHAMHGKNFINVSTSH